MCSNVDYVARMVCAALVIAGDCAFAQPLTSPLACALTRQGVNYHISCDVLRGLVNVKKAIINDGQCQTMQSYYDENPDELSRLKRMLGQEARTFEYRHVYRAGDHFMVYIMPCDVHRYELQTNAGDWGWYATGD
jgi:hypothetical protein